MNSLSVVIINWNSREDTLACLDSLLGQVPEGTQVILVDNGSEDGSEAAVRGRFPSVQVYQSRENLGFAEGANRGIERAAGEWVFVLNNDTTLEPDCMPRLLRAADEAPPGVGMLQPWLVFADRPNVVNSRGVQLARLGQAHDLGYNSPRPDAPSTEEVFCVTGGAGLYRRDMLDALRLSSGFFDRTFFMYFEDVDLGWRARLAGWSALSVGDAAVRHGFQASSQRHGRNWVSVQCRKNRIRMLLKNASRSLLARSTTHAVRELTRELYPEIGLASWREAQVALRDGYRQRPEVRRLISVERTAVEQRWMAR